MLGGNANVVELSPLRVHNTEGVAELKPVFTLNRIAFAPPRGIVERARRERA